MTGFGVLDANTLREYLPLEQGLRLIGLPKSVHVRSLREYLPLEQGLRLPR